MLAPMLHEKFYVSGLWIDEELGVYAGWVARESSFATIPVSNESGKVTLVFSGEEFSELGSSQKLKAGLDENPASYLVDLYEQDPHFPKSLNGRFHGLVVDRNRGRAVLFNDRYGMQKIYYHQSDEAFYFAAEAKAILAVRPELRSIDWRGLGEVVSCGAVLENRTVFRGIEVLPPASAWEFRDRTIKNKRSYFEPKEWEEQEKLEPGAYQSQIRETFTRVLPRYFSGPEKIAMSLTGGLDTRMILAGRDALPGTLDCYTFGSMLRENQDVKTARRVAETCEQSFEVLTAGKEFLSKFGAYAERAIFLTDGLVDVGRAPDLYLNEKARKIAPVRMTGLYGGEILRSVRAFKPSSPAQGVFCHELMSQIDSAKETYAKSENCLPLSFAAFKQNPWYLGSSLSLEQTQVQVRTPFLDNEFVQTVFRSPTEELRSDHISWWLISRNSALAKIPTDRGLTGRRGLAHTLLNRSQEFLFKAEYAYDIGMPQWLARLDHVLSPLHFERAFLGRHKPFHFRVWYRDYLSEYVRQMLLDSRSLSRSYVERKGVELLVNMHLNGSRNFTVELNKLLTLELIHRLFVDSQRFERSSSEAHLAVSSAH